MMFATQRMVSAPALPEDPFVKADWSGMTPF